MRIFSCALYLVALLPTVQACCASDLNVTSLTATTSVAGGGNRTIKFTVHDPDPVTNATTNCAISFASNATAPTNYVRCEDSDFTWKLGSDGGHAQGFTNIGKFGFQVRHHYQDDSLGDPPYNFRAVFASADANATNLDCLTSRVGLKSCTLKPGRVLNMPIWGNS